MSGTRSPFPKAPATEALIVAHGQPSDPAPAEAALAKLAAQVQALRPEGPVRAATMAAPAALESALATAGGPVLVYPLFMAAGWFVTDALRKRLAGAPATVLRPLGLDPGLEAVALRGLRVSAARRGWSEGETEVLLAAHGSATGTAAGRAAQGFAAALAARWPGPVAAGFVEQAPGVDEVARGMGARMLCLPFFAANGNHVRDDVRTALAAAGRADALLPPLGAHPAVPELIAAALRAAEGLGAAA
ncbi:CbiX/SirB N-terminal domain-containing protein [Psychromarinibacter sp. C21-152]|uniref:CbiX/SirB N-terminal domain-containing protein n=1 Tax=Psychromarinibacter sediminicola TaxID=3033385 RepID=A0AAE3NVF9_9RHOB|nr:CbiX/SirB N-terminal domain-containing protein [Psychromarinibacter sediminicola]MDF0602862.1 CbiX/SirB N-terminal domain-containing protein [Psychromarinibacter sediminicola]